MPQVSTVLPGLRYQKYWQEHFSDVGLSVTGLQARNEKTHSRHTVNKLLTSMCIRAALVLYLTCGQCNDGFTVAGKSHFGCANSRNKGTCDNGRITTKTNLDICVLADLKNQLLNPDPFAEFTRAYLEEFNHPTTGYGQSTSCLRQGLIANHHCSRRKRQLSAASLSLQRCSRHSNGYRKARMIGNERPR